MRSARQAPYQSVANVQPYRSAFNASYVKTFTCDMGQLIPVMCDMCIPGDIWKIGNQSVIRFQPLVAPILHEINQFVHYFFVPYRLLWDSWEDFITSGEDGQDVSVLPRWDPTDNTIGSLWDYLGFPTDVDVDGVYPVQFPMNAYNLVWNEYYRDENLQAEVALTQEEILWRNWEKDFLTSALVEQQKGTAPSLPVSGIIPVLGIGKSNQTFPQTNTTVYESDATTSVYAKSSYTSDSSNPGVFEEDPANPGYPRVRVDLSGATTFDIADLRLAFQIQRWMERNNRAGNRYVEFLKAHFGVSPRDDRLQRPEYIGGTKSPVIISEVLQTSQTDPGVSAQGNLAGHGICISNNYAGTYHVKEFGLIIGLMSVMPKPQYFQGVDRQWLQETRYDFPFPEFVNLSEQAIVNGEVLALDADPAHNTTIFGYQGRYDEHRVKKNMVCGQMRDTFNYWHLAREFDPLSPPELNSDFISCEDIRKDIFAVPAEPGLIVEFGNALKAIRPLPITAEPGLIDHD